MDTCIILPLLRVWIMKPPQWTLLWNPPSLSMASLHPDRLKVCQAAFLISFGKKSSWIPKIPGVNLPSYRDGRWVLVERWGLGFWMVFVGCWDAVFFFKPGSMILNDPIWWAVYIVLLVFQNATSREKHGRAVIRNISWICQMLLFWSCGIRNGPPSSGKWRCFLVFVAGRGSPPKDMWHSMILDASGLKLTFEMIE